MSRHRIGCLLAGAALLSSVRATHAEHDTPDATLTLSGGSVAVGIAINWGSGTLSYHGKDYTIGVKGLAVGSVGASSLDASGNVYNLRELSDFDGRYTLLSSEVTAGAGGGVIAMSNANGVTVELVSRTRGLQLSLGGGGVDMRIEK